MRADLCCLFLFLAGATAAREPPSRSGIDGFVTSDIVAVLPGSSIGIDGLASGLHQRITANSSGYYLFDDLRPGSYSVWAEAKGYGCIIYPHLAVFQGQRLRQDFHFVRAKKSPGNCEPLAKKTVK